MFFGCFVFASLVGYALCLFPLGVIGRPYFVVHPLGVIYRVYSVVVLSWCHW